MKMTANYHNHTSRCGHAYGEDEEYVLAAIRNGFEVMGFSDHVILPSFRQYRMRANPEELGGYLSSVASLKEKYKDRIEILAGFEAEWLGPFYESYYRDLLQSGKVDYLILGQHGFMEKKGEFVWYDDLAFDRKGVIERYERDVIEAIKTGLFSYVAHPDIFVYWCAAWGKCAEKAARNIAIAAKEAGIPLEVNMAGSRIRGFVLDEPSDPYYPYAPFWDIVAEVGCDVILGIDAHHPTHYDDAKYEDYLSFCARHHLHLIERLDLKRGDPCI